MKIIIFCGDDGQAAKAHAATLRNAETSVMVSAADMFNKGEPESCDRVVIMGDVPDFRADKIEKAYGEIVEHLPPTDTATIIEVGEIEYLGPPIESIDPIIEEATPADAVLANFEEKPKRKRGRPRKVKTND